MFEAFTELVRAGWLQTALLWIALASTAIIIIVIISENRNPVKSLAWVTILLLLPVAGLVLYLFFGRNIKNQRMISRRNRRKLRKRERQVSSNVRDAGLSNESVQQVNLGRSLTGAQYYPNNEVMVFSTGEDKFRQLKADLRSARKAINIQYYIVSDDRTGKEIAEILIERAAAGVDVRMIYDHVGSFETANKYFKKLKEGGVRATPFFKVTFPSLGTHINWRNHRKIVVIDEEVGYIGGMNIANRYAFGKNKKGTWRDTHLRIKGPAVAALQYTFAVDWNFTGGELIEDNAVGQNINFRDLYPIIPNVGIQILTGGPMSQWSNIAMVFHKAIANARRRVFIQTPYFLPTEGLLRALQSASLAHVDVRIMMPEQSDSVMLTYASSSYIAECLKAGIKIYLYKPGMLHSKMLLVDDEFVSIGSTNFDFRSFDYNFESNAFLYSREMNSVAEKLFTKDSVDCTRVQPSEWRSRPFVRKAAESILRLLSPIL